jgi:hypothetical protein
VVAYTRTAGGARRLRPLNQPRPITINVGEEGTPLGVESRSVEALIETWRIEDEWWRPKPIDRAYWRLLLDDGRTIDVYYDRLRRLWYRQTYT